ncbi:response regulator transcription factor [Acidaminobacter sp. JC074]|uniref:LytR/AlgR family response regulator transcription factor n=1 Tax=Acidaminobacter sp. JC074 TaxID=2530199 RepID=UPI001F114E29|nr:LytTR family DNA-binding domain-containing protein [Acidaminobacter sp. JC074]MCH4887535.1 response regulator transcription factor [Acidaminobacter sp. JC074]
MINCVLAYNDELAKNEVESVLMKHANLNISVTTNGLTDSLIYMNFDVLFLAFNMIEASVIKIIQSIIYANKKVIIISSDYRFAVKAFELNVSDFIPYPFDKKRIEKSLDKIYMNANKNNMTIEYLKQDVKKDLFSFHKNGRLVPVRADEIKYIKAEKKGTSIHTTKGVFKLKKALSNFEKMLDGKLFFKCHRSYTVNLDYVEYIETSYGRTYEATLLDEDDKIPISSKYAAVLKG